jgi:hypothetical protein
MSIVLYISIAWVTLCVLCVALDLIFLLIVEHASDTSQAMGADESSDHVRHTAKLDLAMDETVRRKACELTDTFDALARLEDTVTLAPGDAIPTADDAVARRTQHTGAVIIRDPRLTRPARTLSDQSGGGEETVATTSATQEIGAISKATEVPSAEISHY